MHEQQADAAVAIADEALADLAALGCRRVEAASALICGGLAESRKCPFAPGPGELRRLQAVAREPISPPFHHGYHSATAALV
jgi:hypothetical protein